jgi:hypothetical protein
MLFSGHSHPHALGLFHCPNLAPHPMLSSLYLSLTHPILSLFSVHSTERENRWRKRSLSQFFSIFAAVAVSSTCCAVAMSNPSQDLFQNLVQIVCNTSASQNTRTDAEQQLHHLLEGALTYQDLLYFLTSDNENLLFFTGLPLVLVLLYLFLYLLGQGLASFVWKKWTNISTDEQAYLTNCILQILTTGNLSQFVRSKIEQVLAAICAVSGTLSPVLSIVVELNQPGFENGLSALRTVFEEILKDDTRILPENKTLLYEAATEVSSLSLSLTLFSLCLSSAHRSLSLSPP